MELSIFLAKVLGLYLTIVCLAAILKRKAWEKVITDFENNQGFIVFAGAFTLILGLLVVVAHNIWSRDWRVLITILGYITIFKGLIRLFFPEKLPKLAKKSLPLWTAICFIFFVIGLYLIYIGFGFSYN